MDQEQKAAHRAVGIRRKVDKLGRVSIPAEFRKQFGLNGDVEIIGTDSGVLVRKAPKII